MTPPGRQRAISFGAAIALLCLPAFGLEQVRSEPLDADWSIRTRGPWRMRVDHRDLLAMAHPWQESEKGNFILVWRTMRVPEDWTGPVALTFYCSDDYHTGDWRPDGDWHTAQGFVGHRFKQVMVDNNVVWSEDVCDSVLKGASPRFRVPIDAQPNDSFRLGLMVYDKEASVSVLPGDFHQSGSGQKPREEDPSAFRFMTHVYWGDIALVSGDGAPSEGRRPVEAKVRSLHNRHWPLPPFGDGWTEQTVRFDVADSLTLPKPGFPLRMGVPVAAGKVTAIEELRLQDAKGRGVASQKTVLGRWPDGSIKWVLLDLPVYPAQTRLDLAFAKDSARPKHRTKSEGSGDGLRVEAGPVRFALGPGDPLQALTHGGKAVIGSLRLNALVAGELIPGTANAWEETDGGPFRTTVRMSGSFDALDRHVASFTLDLSAYAGLPYLKMRFRVFSDTAADLALSGLEMRFQLPEAPESVAVPGGLVAAGQSLVQSAVDQRRVAEADLAPQAPFYAQWPGGTLAVKRFAERFPRAVRLEGAELVLDLVAADRSRVVFTPGEAISDEVWLGLGAVDAPAFAAAVERPPLFVNPAYFCATGVIGPAAPHDQVSKLSEKLAQHYAGKDWAALGQHFGRRHFPDSPHYGGLPQWSNNYYERMLGLWSEWFMSGDRAWYDRAVDVCEHLVDVGIVHSAVPGKDWIGALHGPGENHVGGPWNPTLRIAGLDCYHKLTGLPDARGAFLGVADFCARTAAGIDGSSTRQQAGPFDAVCTAYAETGEAVWLDEGAARVESAWRSMDRRRGVWLDMHGSRVYRGNIPWMAAQMGRPLYLWYRMTGDVEAAQALVGLAESVVCENTDWDTPGHVFGYSHNPQFAMTAVYDPLIIPMVFAAYELSGDAFFLEAAKAQYARWAASEDFDSVFNTYWNTPWLVWYLNKYGLLGEKQEE